MTYQLYYWPGIQGRGEFVRLALEYAGAPYEDVARDPHGGMGRLMEGLDDEKVAHPPFAPPYLRDGKMLIGQTAAILLHLGPRLDLVPEDEAGRLWTHQIQLTLMDLVKEAHDTHHPVGSDLYYKDQKPEASRAAAEFRHKRIPKFLDWLEAILSRNPAGSDWLVGKRTSYADLSAFQAVAGLAYAFPKATKKALAERPLLAALAERVEGLPKLRVYLGSDRRIPFNEQGIFRHYPELDG
jgi:glutathione S-transferase